MKKGLLLTVFAIIAGTCISYAQMSSSEIEKMAHMQSVEMKIDGWKVKVGGMPLKQQLIKLYTMQEEQVNGQSKYIIADGQVKGATFEAARVHAMEMAKRNLVSLIDNISLSESEVDIINAEGANIESENLSQTKHKSSSTLDLGNLTQIMTCYKELDGGKVEVSVYIACTRANAVKAKLKRAKADAQSQPKTAAPKVETVHTL